MGLSREEISRKFLEYERDQDLLHLSINNVFVWQITRVWIFLKLLKFPHPPSKMEDNNFLLKTGAKGIRVIINSILFNPFFDFNRSNTLIFQSNRKYPINEHYIDIYTHYLVEELRSKGQSITIYETILENGPKKSNFARKERNTKHLDFLSLLSKVMKVFIRPKLSKVELNQIKSIEVAINEIFHIDLNLHVFFQEAIRKFKSELIVYDFCSRLRKVRKFFWLDLMISKA
ncbi:hypothetical protein [Sphingobacterium sp. IITKGP-BTPF85]|uniref:hypothetical protein n=1 Tax=Sphingobacterium sp. IITKGP-BTPF85 TaxID=1338009 RepID=UPI00038A2102|nr:hypothetical protein [Sphingobacterium sp. IITKGP-BTPF85]KKX51741.1 hypothetical protein L950_0203800 [Sphingobacterium sp. IITKGP-BTPF85]